MQGREKNISVHQKICEGHQVQNLDGGFQPCNLHLKPRKFYVAHIRKIQVLQARINELVRYNF